MGVSGLSLSAGASAAATPDEKDSPIEIRRLCAKIAKEGDFGGAGVRIAINEAHKPDFDRILDLFEKAEVGGDPEDDLCDLLVDYQDLIERFVLRRAIAGDRLQAFRSVVRHANMEDQMLARNLLLAGFSWVDRITDDRDKQLYYTHFCIDLKGEIGERRPLAGLTENSALQSLDQRARVQRLTVRTIPKTANKRA